MDAPVPLQNKFQPLSDHEDTDVEDINSETEQIEDDEEMDQSENVKAALSDARILSSRRDRR
jgi:outer membrane murein-binding lipoprotein Lpp